MNASLLILSVVLLLASAWSMTVCDREARRYFPLQFSDELSSRYFAQYMLLYRSIPLKARRLFVVSSISGIGALAGFATVAYRTGNPVISALLLLACSTGTANLLWQWRRARQ